MKAVLLFAVLGLFFACCVTEKVNFTLRFKGSCVDSNHNFLKIKCTAKAYSQSITTLISTTAGVTMTVNEATDGNFALWNFNVTGLGEETFVGVGDMSFGDAEYMNHTLSFRSLGVGFTFKTNETLDAGMTGLFGISGSSGVFSDATGTITINGRLNYYTRALHVYVNGVAHASTSGEEIQKRLGFVKTY